MAYKEKFNDEDGVWRTIGGRKVFIRKGQNLADAMIESGKFKTKGKMRENYRKEKAKDEQEEEEKFENLKNLGQKTERNEEEIVKAQDELISKYRENRERYPIKQQEEVEDISKKLDKDTEDLNSYDKYNLAINKLEQDENMTRSERAYWTKTRDDYVANEKAREKQIDEESNNWREQVEKNNEQLEKDLKEYQDTHDMAREQDGYYELFRENERRNAKIKQEKPDEKYEPLEAYATYKEKRDKLEGITRDENGNVDWDNVKDATWTGKEYTNDEFLENLEDENWHTERKMLLDANLTNAQMEFVKNNTTFHNGSPSLDREITEELIKGAKGEKYKTPDEIKANREDIELQGIKKELDIVSKNGRYDENGSTREEIHGFRNYEDLKDRYKQLTGKDYDDSDIKIPYDPNKTYKYPNGQIIDQKLMEERYSGETPEKVKRDIEFNKKHLMEYNPKDREFHNAEIKEMEKYYNNMEKYESRISDDYSIKDDKNGYTSNAWKGSNYDGNMSTTDIAKAVTDKMKEAYPDVKISRSSKYFSGGSSANFSIMESDKPLIRSIDDFSDSEIERLYNQGYNKNWFNTKEDFKENLKKDLERGSFDINEHNVDNDYRLTPYGKAVIKDLNKVVDSYNFDDSDGQIDYFHTNFYSGIGIGKYNKPYQVKEKSTPKTTNETMNNAIREKANKSTNDYKVKSGNPIEDMANDRVKERQNSIQNTNSMLDYMKKNNIEKLPDGTTKDDLEFKIWKNQNYVDTANNNFDNLKKNTISEAEKEKYMKDNNLTMFTSRDEYNYLKNKANQSTNETMNNAIREKTITRSISGRNEIKNASPSQIEKGDLIGPKKLLVTAVRPASVEKDGYSSGYSVTTKDSNGNTSRQIISDSARNTIYKKSTNESMNNAIREKASNKYAGTKRWGFGYANDDNIPVYDNKIDYGGDFSHANLQTLSDSELKEVLNKQTELLNKANAEKVGDRRTRNGRMQAIFNKSEKLRYNNGVNRIKEELVRRENEKYPQYKGTPYEVKYYSLEDVMKDKDSPLNQYIRNKANEKKAYRDYLKEHPESKMSLKDFRNMKK